MDGDWHIYPGGFVDLGVAFTNLVMATIPGLLFVAVILLGVLNFAVKVVQSRRDGTYDEDKLPQVLRTNVLDRLLPLVLLALTGYAFALFNAFVAFWFLALFYGAAGLVLYVELRQLTRRVEFEPPTVRTPVLP